MSYRKHIISLAGFTGPVIFLLSLLLISWYYHYNQIIFKKPQSIHWWRQTDCASITLNYYQNGMRFFSPEIHNLISDNGTSGKCATSEIPLLYYSIAFLYKIFGHHDYIYRILNTFIFFLGLFYLFRLFRFLINDLFWSVTLTLFFFTSPVLVYYANNYLTNTSAFAFAIIAWYHFIQYYRKKTHKNFYFSSLFFFLAGSMKITGLFSVVSLAVIFMLELLNLVRCRSDRERILPKGFIQLIPLSLGIVLITAWILYAKWYNSIHDCYYFSTTTFPVWELTRESISSIVLNIRKLWFTQYFSIWAHLFLMVAFLYLIIFYRSSDRLLVLLIIILIPVFIAYILLQFYTFKDHDYYTIDMYILPVLVTIAVFSMMKNKHPRLFESILFKSLFFCFLLYNIWYAKTKLDERYGPDVNNYYAALDFYQVSPYLEQIGLSAEDTVVSISGETQLALYLMNLKGWVEYIETQYGRGERIPYNRDSAAIQLSINKGAKYLIVKDQEELFRKPYLQSYASNLIGRYNKILFFDLVHRERNFKIPERRIIQTLSCDAELLSEDGKYFISLPDSVLFEYGSTRNNEKSYSGKFSAKLNPSYPYSMTIFPLKVMAGESFEANVKYYGTPGKGMIVASGSNTGQFYFNENTLIPDIIEKWYDISIDFFIPDEMNDKELIIYLWYSGNDSAYFDDFTISRYSSYLMNN